MADKHDGEDLFEDLDKFFAPIRDIDFDEPDEAAGPVEPREEHVDIVGHEPSAPTPEPSGDAAIPGDDDAWYETTVLDVEGGLGDEPLEEGETVDEVEVEVSARPSDIEPVDDSIVDVAGDEDSPIWASTDEEAWSEDDVDAPAGDAHAEPTVTAPLPTLGLDEIDDAGDDMPTESELEAAAEHFAGSMRGETSTDDFDDDEIGDVVLEDDAQRGGIEHGSVLEDDEGILGDLEAPRTVVVGTEGYGGPSWQEPTSVEVGADFDQRGGGVERDVPAAFMTGIVLAAVALGALAIDKAVFAVVATGVALFAQGEFFGVMVKRSRQPATAVGLVAGALMMGGAYLRGESALLAMFSLGLVATFLWFMTVPAAHRSGVAGDLGLTVLNMAWIPLLAGYLVALLSWNDGTSLVITVIGLTLLYDSTAFLTGSIMGGAFIRVGFAPSISPKKSWEGAIAGLVVTVIVSASVVSAWVDVFKHDQLGAAIFGIVVAVAATFGDLAESLLKRDLGIKDMGSVLPGHGGVLDRIDSLLFVAPAAYLFLRVITG